MSDSNYLAWASKWDVEILQILLELCSKDGCKLCDKKFHDNKKFCSIFGCKWYYEI